MKDIKLLISSLLIICAFFLGYVFSETKNSSGASKVAEESIYINVKTTSKNITIDSEHKNVILLLDGQETNSGSIVIK